MVKKYIHLPPFVHSEPMLCIPRKRISEIQYIHKKDLFMHANDLHVNQEYFEVGKDKCQE